MMVPLEFHQHLVVFHLVNLLLSLRENSGATAVHAKVKRKQKSGIISSVKVLR